ncbi:MAG: NAD(P)/FAD-dependent oxidoreductase [Christensenellales bacterium]
MEFVKGTTYFDKSTEKIKQYRYLNSDADCDILIVGGGINGAVLNFYLSKFRDVMLVDSNRLGTGSTCVATALLEFQLDDFAQDLKPYLTEKQIVDVYQMGLDSIKEINAFIYKYGNKCNFKTKSSFLYSNKNKDFKKLKREFEFRKQHGFDCAFYTQQNNPFDFKIVAGIYDKNGGAELNPYLFTKQMIDNSLNQNKIFENTNIVRLEQRDGKVFCHTNYGETIRANKVVLATGFNYQLFDDYAKELCTKTITYSIVTQPIKDIYLYDKALVHDCLDSYHYLRLLPDNRIIFGGEDTTYKDEPINEKLALKKYDKLLKDLKTLFPKYKDKIQTEYAFCGVFAQTDNNLGIIGKSINPNIMYFSSCGANGIINTFCGVRIIQDILCGRQNPLQDLFSPTRNLKN